MRWFVAAVFVLVIAPVATSAALYAWTHAGVDWRAADRSSAGLLPPARQNPEAVVRVYSAPTVSWRGVVATHTWIVTKRAGESAYRRYDYTAWGNPIWIDRFAPDGRWFGKVPDVIYAADGAAAEAMIPAIEAAVESYRFRHHGDYRAWPGPNSNTFVATVMRAVPQIDAVLPPTAIGKDFPADRSWISRAAGGLGASLNLGGYLGLTIGWIEGLELNIFGAVIGIDIRRPALKIPAFGRIGLQ